MMMRSALRRRLLAIPPRAVSFDELGFAPADAAVRGRLEKVLETFVHGYNLSLAIDDPAELADALRRQLDAHHVGFAFEGVGLSYALRDLMAPWKSNRPSRLRAFLDGPGSDHDYIVAVGAGFAIARLPWGRRLWPSYSRRLDPLIGWCLPDGYGFHEGIFHPARYIAGRAEPPAALPHYARQLFDSGVGRSLWWSQGADPRRIAREIDGFAPARRPEMWCGIGTAAAYAGGHGDAADAALLELLELAGPCRADFLSGIPFAARMRQKGGNPSPVTDRACELLLGQSAGETGDWIAATAERVIADESIEREVRLRDSYLLVRQRLVEELRNSAQGEPQCRVLRHSKRSMTASS
jgi:enediyne biosynthesis protein E3